MTFLCWCLQQGDGGSVLLETVPCLFKLFGLWQKDKKNALFPRSSIYWKKGHVTKGAVGRESPCMAIGAWQNGPFLYFVENQVIRSLLLSLTAMSTLLGVDFIRQHPLASHFCKFNPKLVQWLDASCVETWCGSRGGAESPPVTVLPLALPHWSLSHRALHAAPQRHHAFLPFLISSTPIPQDAVLWSSFFTNGWLILSFKSNKKMLIF